MTPPLTISDHALLRYMERFYGVDTAAWHEAMLSDVEASLSAYQGRHTPGQPAFVIFSMGRVVTCLNERARFVMPPGRPNIAVPRIMLGDVP